MLNCLVIVERSGFSAADLITTEFSKTLSKALGRVQQAKPNELRKLSNNTLNKLDSNKTEFHCTTEVSLTGISLATSLHHAGVDFALLDDEDILDKYHDKIEAFIEQGIKYICISTTFLIDKKSLVMLVRFFQQRSPETRIIIGGQVLQLWGQTIYKQLQNIFCYCSGDFDTCFGPMMAELLQSKIPSAFQTGTADKGNAAYSVMSYVENLDLTPLPDWQLLTSADINDRCFSSGNLPERIPIEERRGCPNRCAYCSYPTLNKNRRKSPERIIQELRHIKKIGYKKVNFIGSEFLTPIKESRKTLKLLIQENLNLDIKCFARIDVLDKHPDMIPLMEEAGITEVYFGVESGDTTILKGMNKFYKLEKIPAVISKLKAHNIQIWASLIFGFPGENDETIQNTTNFLIQSNFTTLELHTLQVVPNTPLHMHRDKYKLNLLGNFWSHPTMSLKDIPRIIKKVFVDIHPTCDSHIYNIFDSIGKYFFKGNYTSADLIKLSKILQNMIYIEYNDAIIDKDTALLNEWDKMKLIVHQIPTELLTTNIA